MFCKNCGNKLEKNEAVCPYCMTPVNDNYITPQPNDDKTNIWLGILGFFIPLVGIILYFVYDKENHKRAMHSIKGAVIGIITKLVITVVYLVLVFTGVFRLSKNVVSYIMDDSSYAENYDVTGEETTSFDFYDFNKNYYDDNDYTQSYDDSYDSYGYDDYNYAYDYDN